MMLLNNPPYDYNNINAYYSSMNPSTLHAMNTALSRMFCRYLIQRAMSVYKFNLPESFSKKFFLYTLFCIGRVSVFYTNEFGLICGLPEVKGYNIYYEPTSCIMVNPAYPDMYERKLAYNKFGTMDDATIFTLTEDWHGIMDMVAYYADMFAIASESLSTNIFNAKVSTIFPAKDKNESESYKKMFDNVASGQPAVFIRKELFNEDGSVKWQPFNTSMAKDFLGDKILDAWSKLIKQFDDELGIPNIIDKKERTNIQENTMKISAVRSRADLWLENLKEAADLTNSIFGSNITVDWRDNNE